MEWETVLKILSLVFGIPFALLAAIAGGVFVVESALAIRDKIANSESLDELIQGQVRKRNGTARK